MEHVSFGVERGTTLAILGGSGSGKSTLLRYLIGLERPMAGRIDIDGVGEPHRPRGRAAVRRAVPVGRALQLVDARAEPRAAAHDLDEHPRPARARSGAGQARIWSGSAPFAEHLPGEISGGMKKRAGIARAMMLEPDLLFFDEPSAGLDPISAVELDQLIITLSRDLGITIVIVTHELPSIFLVADNCIVLDKEAKGIVARRRSAPASGRIGYPVRA